MRQYAVNQSHKMCILGTLLTQNCKPTKYLGSRKALSLSLHRTWSSQAGARVGRVPSRVLQAPMAAQLQRCAQAGARGRPGTGSCMQCIIITRSCLEARCVCRQAAVRAAKILSLVGLARSKQNPINGGYGAKYLYRPPPAGAAMYI